MNISRSFEGFAIGNNQRGIRIWERAMAQHRSPVLLIRETLENSAPPVSCTSFWDLYVLDAICDLVPYTRTDNLVVNLFRLDPSPP